MEWCDLLLDVDLDFVKSRKAYVQAVRELEGSVAASLGVAAIFGTNPQHLLAEPSYREFLEWLAVAAAESLRHPPHFCSTSLPHTPMLCKHLPQGAPGAACRSCCRA
ncbi:hypothetical protein DUNSADRAFT_1623 [Dunaliella salina]|uniref:Uncharacterized protein n=1 Tax=Dunaliella salina TaxID=3046 RepID=A0ABQ7H8L0_DUNSA|nr:hypothetical protein DUNSADRAFT_1623 [Dunaliella salina]|eukprot:KAF5843196.1 hypothetical protein DUNSADRAFT_1623 [Dunaliella salina]